MKRMNQNHRGEVCGVRSPRARNERPPLSKTAEFWERKSGVREPLVGVTLAALEAKLKTL